MMELKKVDVIIAATIAEGFVKRRQLAHEVGCFVKVPLKRLEDAGLVRAPKNGACVLTPEGFDMVARYRLALRELEMAMRG